jgi:hypothetical protein
MFPEQEDRAMATVMDEALVEVKTPTLQDIVDRLGGIPLSRILAKPAPGTASWNRIPGDKVLDEPVPRSHPTW